MHLTIIGPRRQKEHRGGPVADRAIQLPYLLPRSKKRGYSTVVQRNASLEAKKLMLQIRSEKTEPSKILEFRKFSSLSSLLSLILF